MRYKKEWKAGDQAALARAADVSPQHLNNVLRKRKNMRVDTAQRVVHAALVLGYRLTVADLVWSRGSENPLLG